MKPHKHIFESDGGNCEICDKTWIEIQDENSKKKIPLSLDECTDDQLQAEMDKRKRKRKKIKSPRQKAISAINIKSVIDACEGYIKQLEEDPAPDKHYVFEAAMTAVYGRGIWDFINERS